MFVDFYDDHVCNDENQMQLFLMMIVLFFNTES